jgi:hypothetical protein
MLDIYNDNQITVKHFLFRIVICDKETTVSDLWQRSLMNNLLAKHCLMHYLYRVRWYWHSHYHLYWRHLDRNYFLCFYSGAKKTRKHVLKWIRSLIVFLVNPHANSNSILLTLPCFSLFLNIRRRRRKSKQLVELFQR